MNTLRTTLVIARREFAVMFIGPAGWITMALFALLSGGVFAINCLQAGEPASLRPMFSAAIVLLLPVAPAISMRLLSEEFRSGTFETLATAPVGVISLVLGKFLGSWVFLLSIVAPTLVYAGVLLALSDGGLDPGAVLSGYTGLILMGGLYLAAGTLASATTSSQTLAYLATLLGLVAFVLLTTTVADRLPDPLASWLRGVSVSSRMSDLSRGLIPVQHIVYFLGLIAVCLTGAATAVTVRRNA